MNFAFLGGNFPLMVLSEYTEQSLMQERVLAPPWHAVFIPRVCWGRLSGHGRGAVLPPPDASRPGGTTATPALHQLILSSPPRDHKVPFTLSTRHAPAWSLPQMAYVLLGHLMKRFYFIIYISAAAHKSLHSGSNGLSFSCHYSLKRALNQLHKGCDLK